MLDATKDLVGNELHVWVFDLDRTPCDTQVLSPEEKEKADRFVRSFDQTRFRAAHVSVREILGRYLDVLPAGIAFATNPVGKPYLRGSSGQQITFNLSHSEHHGLLALAQGREVGVDVEVERQLSDLYDLARQIMSSSEFQKFELLDSDLADATFFGLWTRKEAILKAVGTGLSIDPRRIDLGLENRDSSLELRGTTWSVAPLCALLPLKAAVAVEGQLPAIRMFNWP
jgi:4'-phosphopantetheinyl transferase